MRRIFLGLTITLFMGACASSPASAESGNSAETYRQLNLFGDVFERVKEQYVDDVTDEELIEAAISGMLANLDPHSSYLDEKDYKDMQVQTKGSFGGLGIEVTMENGLLKVVSPIDDTPAYRAGVQAGDYITHLDGESILGFSLNDAVDKMRGKVGSKIKLTIRREGSPDPIYISITRDVIKLKSVRSRLEGNVGYIRITTFSQNTGEEAEKAVNNLKKEYSDAHKDDSEIVGYVLDLRNNPGGLLSQAIAVSDLFLEQGEIVSTRGRNEEDTRRDNAKKGDIAEGKPMVVLINGGSASASEIVSGALQDHRRAILLGTKSFGKGSVQTIIALPGHGAMRLTTARYYTPSGRSIQAKGIDPDIYVEPAKVEKIDITGGTHESDLRGALDNDKSTAKKPKQTVENTPVPETDEKEEAQDYQLSRALDLLRGLALYDTSNVSNPFAKKDAKETKK